MSSSEATLSSSSAHSTVSDQDRMINSSNEETDAPEKLPEKWEMLIEFFDCLHTAIQMCRLEGAASTFFANIYPKIKNLTDRRFSYDQLAQVMFILPEVMVKKIGEYDELTTCTKIDLLVTMYSEDGTVATDSEHQHLKKLFRSRLSDFAHSLSHSHSHGGKEVPKAILPDPFNQSSEDRLNTILAYPTTRLSISSKDETGELSFESYTMQAPTSNISVDSNLNQIVDVTSHFRQWFSKETNKSRFSKLIAAFDNPDPSVSLDVAETSSTAASLSPEKKEGERGARSTTDDDLRTA